jgi:transcriptional regulator with XRE-family HTH domain
MSAQASPLDLGRKVAEQRRRRGWSQPELAERLGKPVAWVSRLERGLAQIDGSPILPSLAGPPAPADLRARGPGQRPAAPAEALRRILDGSPAYRPRSSALAVGSEADRHFLTATVWDLAAGGRYDELAALVTDLLPVLDATLRTAPRHLEPGLHQLTASCYQACSGALARLGDYEGAALAADRALVAAECADDPVAVAAGAYLLVCILIDVRRHEAALTIAAAAAEALQGVAAAGSRTAISFRGALTLLCALASARAGDTGGAEEYLSRASVMAGRVSYSIGDHVIGFSADHVALYEIAISIESAAPAHAGRPALEDA